MSRISQLARQSKHMFKTDSLFRNSAFLMASTGISAVLGFGFWLFVARLYRPEDIGTASALISVATLLGNISLLGLGASLIRFLPSSKEQNRDINASVITVGTAAMVAAVTYLLLGPMLGVHIALIDEGWEQLTFVLLMAIVGLNSLTDSVFIANRRAELHTLAYTTLAVVKLILPLGLVALGALGIFAAYSLATVASLVLSLWLMRSRVGYRALSRPNWSLLRSVRRYATNNYIGLTLSSITAQVMPLFILTSLGEAPVAFFAMAWTMANFLYIIPIAMAQSLLAESSTEPTEQRRHAQKAVKLLALVLAPTIALAIIAAPYILHIFGPQYAANGTIVFQILAFGTIFVAINEVCNTRLNIQHRSSGVVAAQLGTLLVTFASAMYLMQFGLAGIGIAFVLGNIVGCISHAVYFGLGLGKRPDRQPDVLPQEVALPGN